MIEDTERRLEYGLHLFNLSGYRIIEEECRRHLIEVKQVDCMEELHDTIGRMANGKVSNNFI